MCVGTRVPDRQFTMLLCCAVALKVTTHMGLICKLREETWAWPPLAWVSSIILLAQSLLDCCGPVRVCCSSASAAGGPAQTQLGSDSLDMVKFVPKFFECESRPKRGSAAHSCATAKRPCMKNVGLCRRPCCNFASQFRLQLCMSVLNASCRRV